MKAYEIKPNSFCNGVKRAIDIIKKAISDENTPKPIYMYGHLVHNEKVCNSFDDVIIINPSYDLNLIKSGSVIITAHGVSPKVYKTLMNNNINIIDTTCINVLSIHKKITHYTSLGKNVFIVGSANHPEVIGYLGISDKVYVYNDSSNADDSFVTTQTTLVYEESVRTLNKIKETYPNVICNLDICKATSNRQNALISSLNLYDYFIIIGDKMSNNCKSLYNILSINKKEGILISDISDLNEIDLSKYEKIGVTAGASTPRSILLEVIDCINNNKEFVSHLSKYDYLNTK